jgi:hypothetical protein
LLDFDGSSELECFASEYGDQITYLAHRANVQFDVSALLIRPDGYVAWSAEGQSPQESIRRAALSWLDRAA